MNEKPGRWWTAGLLDYVIHTDPRIFPVGKTKRDSYGPVTVPPDSYFVLGDNRNKSGDSHYGWFVAKDDIVGKAWFSYWPLSDFGFVLNYSFN